MSTGFESEETKGTLFIVMSRVRHHSYPRSIHLFVSASGLCWSKEVAHIIIHYIIIHFYPYNWHSTFDIYWAGQGQVEYRRLSPSRISPHTEIQNLRLLENQPSVVPNTILIDQDVSYYRNPKSSPTQVRPNYRWNSASYILACLELPSYHHTWWFQQDQDPHWRMESP